MVKIETTGINKTGNRRKVERPRDPTRSSWRTLLFVAILGTLTVYHRRWNSPQYLPGGWYDFLKTSNTKNYALCSAEGERSIHIVDVVGSVVECIAIEGDVVVGSGALETLDLAKTRSVKRVPPGAVVLPGLSDSHCHILEYGAGRQMPLGDAKSVEETVEMVATYIRTHPEIANNMSETIVAWGWDHEAWAVPAFPTASDLEKNKVTRGRPIILQSKDGHAIWVSQATLSANQPYPEDGQVSGGVIRRDVYGNPTGIFLDAAQDLIPIPPVSETEKIRRFYGAAKDALSYGLTSLHDAGFKPESLELFMREVERHGRLPVRVYGMTHFDEYGAYWGNATQLVSNGGGKERFSARSVKIFADGALRTGGAALYEPYTDNPSSSGQMRLSADTLNRVIPRFLKDGWQVNVHAIGDRANGLVLDAFERALNDMGLKNATSLRPRLEHAQILTPKDIERIGKLGVIASVQPTHVISDMWFGEDRLGPERVKGLYAFRSLLSSGARITLGSDFPVESINPLAGFYAAITRLSTDGRSPRGSDGWFPEQRLTRLEALRGMTIDPAYASFTEASLGSLEIGKRADYVVLSQDIMKVPVENILETKVLATALDGEVVYGAL